MVESTRGARHWTRVLTWSALAAFSYPIFWFAFRQGTGTGFDAGYLALLTDQLVSFLTLVVGSALGVHLATTQPRRISTLGRIAYGVLIAWFAFIIAVAGFLYQAATQDATLLLALIALSPLLLLVGAPGFLVVAFGVWTENRRRLRLEGVAPRVGARNT